MSEIHLKNLFEYLLACHDRGRIGRGQTTITSLSFSTNQTLQAQIQIYNFGIK